MTKLISSPSRRRIGACTAAATLAFALAGSGAAQPGGGPINSDTPGALEIPELWDCSRVEPEYRDWLEAGNPPETWKYVGKTYRDMLTDELYTWQDWLDWADNAGCLPGALENPPGVPSTGLIISGVVTAIGVGVVAASGGSGPKSPG